MRKHEPSPVIVAIGEKPFGSSREEVRKVKHSWSSVVPVGALLLLAALIRIFLQQGGKPLKDAYPWNYILMLATVVVAVWYLSRLYRKTSARSSK